MGDDIAIPLDSMAELSSALGSIISEYESAGDKTAALEAAIGSPHQDRRLATAAGEFEAAWNDKRETQRRHLEEMKKRIDETKAAWEELDVELASAAKES